MADTGYRFSTSEAVIANTGGAGWGWQNLANIRADDGTNTHANVKSASPSRSSAIFEAQNFGFSSALIPNGATINSVELQVQWGLPWSTASLGIQAYVSGAAVGSENVETTALYSSPQIRTYDITAQRAWTPADLRDGVFAVRLGAGNSHATSSANNFYVDYAAVRVTFTLPTASGTLAATEARDTAAMAGKLGIIGTLAAPGGAKDAASFTGLLSDGSQSVQAYVGGVAVGTIHTNKESALADVTFDITAARNWTPADFRDAALAIHIGSHNDGPPVVSSWDCVSLRVLYAQPPAGEYTGTLAATEAPDVAAIFGGIIATGTLAASEANDVAAIVGGIYAQGALAATEAKDVAAFTGSATTQGIIAATEAKDVAAFAGTVAHTGTLSATDAPDSAAFAGTVAHAAILAATELPDAAAFTGTATLPGALAATEAPDVAAFAGSATHFGTLAATEAKDRAAFAEAELTFVGEIVATEAPDAAAFVGGLTASGTLAASEAKDVAAIVAKITATGTLAATEAKDTAAFTGTGVLGGVIAATEARDVALFVGNARTLGNFDAVEAQDHAIFTTSAGWTGTLAATEAPDAAIFGGAVHALGTLAASEARDTAAFTGTAITQGVLAAVEAQDHAVFVQVDIAGILSAIEASDIVLATGSVHDFAVDIIGDDDRATIHGGCVHPSPTIIGRTSKGTIEGKA